MNPDTMGNAIEVVETAYEKAFSMEPLSEHLRVKLTQLIVKAYYNEEYAFTPDEEDY